MCIAYNTLADPEFQIRGWGAPVIQPEISGGGAVCTATEMIPTIEMIPAIEMIPNHHRNDPHHRNDTGGHHRNDPRNIGNGIKGTRKTGKQFSAWFLFIYIASFYGVQFTFYRTLFCSKLFFFWFNTRQYLFKRCNSLMSSISSNFLKIFLQENLFNKIVLKQNKSNFAIRLCLPDDVMTTVMTSVTGSHYNTCFPINFGTCTSCCSCHLKSLTT